MSRVQYHLLLAIVSWHDPGAIYFGIHEPVSDPLESIHTYNGLCNELYASALHEPLLRGGVTSGLLT